MKTLATCLLELAAFLELSDDSIVDPDAAVGAMESVAASLAEASDEEKSALREAARRLAKASKGSARTFYSSFMFACGLEDKPPVARAARSKRPPEPARPAALRALTSELRLGTDDDSAALQLIEANPELAHAQIDSQGSRPLHLAALYGFTAVVRGLLSAGADVRARDRHGRTALHEAILNNHQPIVRLLIKAGADLNAADRYGETPLAITRTMPRKAIADLLRKHGARD
jgi:ankyrin repeat protein